MGCDLRDREQLPWESRDKASWRKRHFFIKALKYGIRMECGCVKYRTTAGLRGTWSGRKHSGADMAASHTPSATSQWHMHSPPVEERGPYSVLFSHLGQPDLPPMSLPQASPLARCHHLSIQRATEHSLHPAYFARIQSYIVKIILCACSPRASGHFQAKSPLWNSPSPLFPPQVWFLFLYFHSLCMGVQNVHIALLITCSGTLPTNCDFHEGWTWVLYFLVSPTA